MPKRSYVLKKKRFTNSYKHQTYPNYLIYNCRTIYFKLTISIRMENVQYTEKTMNLNKSLKWYANGALYNRNVQSCIDRGQS